MLKLNNFLKIGAMGIALVLAAVMLGTGQLVYAAVLVLAVVVFFFFWPKPKKRAP